MSKNIFPKLRGVMAENNDTLLDLMQLLNISESTLRLSLKGKRDFTLEEVQLLANRYDFKIKDLFVVD